MTTLSHLTSNFQVFGTPSKIVRESLGCDFEEVTKILGDVSVAYRVVMCELSLENDIAKLLHGSDEMGF